MKYSLKRFLKNLKFLLKHDLDKKDKDLKVDILKSVEDIYYYEILDKEKEKHRYMLDVLNYDKTIDLLLNQPKNFCRFGDGEIEIMMGNNIPFQKYNEELKNIMLKILESNNENLYVGINYNYFHSIDNFNETNKNFYLLYAKKYRDFLLKHCNKNRKYIAAGFTQLYMGLNNFNYKQEQYIGKNFAASMLIDKITDTHGYKLYETPTGFKWFANLLYENKMPVAMEDSAGACFYTRDNKLFTSDKDGISVALLACQMCAASNKSLGLQYDELCKHYGQSYYKRLDISIDSGIKDKIKKCAKEASKLSEFVGSKVIKVQTQASGNQESLGGVKLVTTQGFFAIRASGTEDIYKIYAQSLQSPDHLEEIIKEANDFVASL